MRAGDLIADRFELLVIAGSGGMASVWRAHDRLENRSIALKLMLRTGGEEAQRFAREARVMRQLSHPGIVRYVADGATPTGEPWLAMEWLEGEDLAATLLRGPMAAQDALSVCIAIADALEAAHALGLVHRDLKPSNVFLVGGDPKQAKLIDFGIVRRVQAQLTPAQTMVGVFVGSPGYTAPEQITASSQIDGRADVFSLGCVLFRCLTGRPVFSGEYLTALLAKVLLEEAPRVSTFVGVPAALDALVAQMLSKSAAARPATAAAVARELRALGPVAFEAARERESTFPMDREQVWLCVLMVGVQRGALTGPTLEDDATRPSEAVADETARMAQVAEVSGARLVVMLGGTHILLWEGAGSPLDMAMRAARAALSIQVALPGVALGLASGRAAVSAAVPVGAALERAAGCVKRSVGQIAIDEVLAQMLEPTFAVTRRGVEATLVGERTRGSAERTLLGKSTQCFGREVELSTLSAVLSECVDDGAATAVIVTGEAGVGKSRVRHEWAKSLRASHPEAQVWSAQGDAMGEGGSFGVAAALVADACGVGIGMPRAEVQRRIAERVASCVAAPEQKRVASRLSEMCGAGWEVEVDEALRQARREPVVMGDQLRAAWEDFLVASCTLCPVVLVVDDVQWADRPSVELMDRALRNFRKLPWMVVAVGRPEHREKFPNLWSARGAREVSVAPLKDRPAERLLRAALGSELAQERIAAIVERGAGNPYLLEELVRAESEGRGGEVPESVLAMVETRLLRLDAESRWVLRAASVLGMQVDARGVSAVLAGAAVADTLEALDRLELLASLPSGGYRFRQVTVREAAYAQLVDEDRILGHARAGAWLASQGEKDASKVAEHFERGEQRAQAAAWWAVAAEQGLEGSDFAAAIVRAERAVASDAEGDHLARALLAKAEAHQWRGEARAQLDAAQVAVAVAGDDLKMPGIVFVANAAARLGETALLGSLVAPALVALRGSLVSDAAVVGAALVAVLLLHAGEAGLAVGLCESLDALARDGVVRGAACRARLMNLSGLRLLHAGDYASNLHAYQNSANAFLEAGDPRRAAAARMNAGYTLSLLGASDEAASALRAVLVEVTRMGLVDLVAAVQQNLGLALGRVGAFAEAEQVARASVAHFYSGDDRRMEATSRYYLARSLLGAGKHAEAESEARRACSLLAPNHPITLEASVALADVLLARGDGAARAEALALVQAAYDAIRGDAQAIEEPAFARRVYLDALEAAGQYEEAGVARHEARAWLMERAARITSAHYLRTFMHGESDNARIMGHLPE